MINNFIAKQANISTKFESTALKLNIIGFLVICLFHNSVLVMVEWNRYDTRTDHKPALIPVFLTIIVIITMRGFKWFMFV